MPRPRKKPTPAPAAPAVSLHEFLERQRQAELLRFITCGSVDDGKSTLIGRLFYESKMIYEDQLAAIRKDSSRYGTTGEEVDLALFTDGLEDERQQGITIDVAYRYFSTDKRKFIIADTPGHEQYTRNMATGASTADLAIILIDARHGVLTQTKRHSFIVSLLGIKHVVVAINKMDLVDYSEEVFERIKNDYQAFASRLELPDVHFMPISALKGDNVVRNSPRMSWYQGSPLVHFLETVYIGSDRNLADLRFPVQLVLRPNLDFRGFAGTVASGIIRKGDEVMVLPSRRTSRVKAITTFDGELEEAFAPQSVTLTLEDEVDISRGDMLVRPGNVPRVEQKFEALIVWMHDEKLVPGKSYLFKQTSRVLPGSVSTLRYRVDVNTLHRQEAPALGLNEIGRCQVALSAPVAYDAYRRNRGTGSFIIIDRLTNATVGAGMILDRESDQRRGSLWDAEPASSSLSEQLSKVTAQERAQRFGQTPVTLLLTGLPGAGKSSIASALERRLFDEGRAATVIDGQNLRLGLSRELSFDETGRSENIRRAAEVAKLLNQAGLICILALVSPQEAVRQRARELVGAERFFIVHVTAAEETCRARQAGKQAPPTADEADVRFEPPTSPDLVLDTERNSIADSVEQLLKFLSERNVLN
jgi:bifunctional enzyme CysN/CysC